MFRFAKAKRTPLIIVTIFASFLISCDRQKVIDDYIALGMPPELAKTGIMIVPVPGPDMPEQEDNR